jgi:hypothetical protein
VAKSENIDKDDAKKKVVEYVDKASKNLTDNNEHLIEGLGKLIKESTGKITFEEISEAAKKVSKKKEPKKAAEIKEEKKAAEIKEEKKAAEIKEPKKVDEIKEEKKVKPDEIKKEISEKKVEAKEAGKPPPAKPQAEKEISKVPQQEPVEKKTAASIAQEQSKREIITKKEVVPEAKAKEEHKLKPAGYQKTEIRKKKSNSQIIVWIILILIINAAIISWFVFNDEIRGLFEKKPKDISTMEEKAADQSSNVATGQEEEAVSEEADIEEISPDMQKQISREPEAAPEIEEETVSYSEKRYYIVAGCFRDERNADALVKKLKQKGYEAEKFGKIGNLHAVSYSSFIDRTEAQNQLRKIREEEEMEAWITYY